MESCNFKQKDPWPKLNVLISSEFQYSRTRFLCRLEVNIRQRAFHGQKTSGNYNWKGVNHFLPTRDREGGHAWADHRGFRIQKPAYYLNVLSQEKLRKTYQIFQPNFLNYFCFLSSLGMHNKPLVSATEHGEYICPNFHLVKYSHSKHCLIKVSIIIP